MDRYICMYIYDEIDRYIGMPYTGLYIDEQMYTNIQIYRCADVQTDV